MEYKKYGNTIVARLEIGEEVISALKKIAEAENITAASVSGIGAADHTVIGLYNVSTQQYTAREFNEEVELASLLGNLSRKNGESYVHVHAVIGREGGKTRSGHLSKAIISATCELFITVLDAKIERFLDEKTGLNLMILE